MKLPLQGRSVWARCLRSCLLGHLVLMQGGIAVHRGAQGVQGLAGDGAWAVPGQRIVNALGI